MPGRFYAGALWGSSTLAWDAAWFRAHGVKMPMGAHYVVPGRDKIPLTEKLDPTDTGVMRLQFRQQHKSVPLLIKSADDQSGRSQSPCEPPPVGLNRHRTDLTAVRVSVTSGNR